MERIVGTNDLFAQMQWMIFTASFLTVLGAGLIRSAFSRD
jgi:hypothetical protein